MLKGINLAMGGCSRTLMAGYYKAGASNIERTDGRSAEADLKLSVILAHLNVKINTLSVNLQK